MPRIRKVFSMVMITLIVLGLTTSHGFPGVIDVNSWDSLSAPGWGYYYGSPTIDGSTGTPDPANALRFKYPEGFQNGNAPCIVEYVFAFQTQELWVQYYFKYSSNWTRHPVNDKQAYFGNGSSIHQGNFFVGMGKWGKANIFMENQIGWGPGSQTFYPNTGYNPTLENGKWYKLTLHAVQNTPGQSNGIIQVWIDDKLVVDHKTVPYRSSSQGHLGFGCMQFTPVWGGTGSYTKPATEYFWVDRSVISTAPIGAAGTAPPPAAVKVPKPPSNMKIAN